MVGRRAARTRARIVMQTSTPMGESSIKDEESALLINVA